MRAGVRLFFFLSGLFSALSAKTQDRVTIGVMDFIGKAGVDQNIADVMADILAEKISRMGDVNVITKAEIMSMLTLEDKRQIADCGDEACVMEEIGGALGMGWMVNGNLGRFGETFVFNLKLFNTRTAEIPSRVSRTVKGTEEELVEELLDATRELFEKVSDRLPLAPTVSVASRRLQLITESPSAVTVLTRTDIRQSGAASLPDLLRRIPGFDVYELKSSNPLVGARALTEDANNLVLLLIDGREAMTEVTGFAYWSGLTINLAEIERIEVIRGPGSTLYGANAFAAVVSITTASDQSDTGADFSLTTGQEGFGDLFARAHGRFKLEPGILTFSAGFSRMDRLSPEDMQDRFILGWRSHGYMRYQLKDELDVSIHAGIVFGELQNYFHMGDMRLTDATNYWLMGKSDLKLSESVRLKAQVYHSRYTTVYVYRTSLRAHDIWIGNVKDLDITTPTVDGQLQLDYQALDNLLLTGGVNLRRSSIRGTGLTPEETSELRGAGFVHAQWQPYRSIQLTGGLRLDLNSKTEPALSPRAVLVFGPWQDHSWRIGYTWAFRKPSMFERDLHVGLEDHNPALPEVVGTMAREFANEDLVNEKVHSFEAGWRSRLLKRRLSLSVDLFYNIYQDTIYFYVNIPTRIGLPDIANSEFHYENQDADIHALGGELEISLHPSRDLVFWGNIGMRVLTKSGTEEHKRREPKVRLNLGGGYRPDAGIQFDLSLHYVSAYEMPLMDPENIFDNPTFMSLGENALVIGRAGYRMPMGRDRMIECGLVFRIPLGNPFREYAGIPFPDSLPSTSNSDFGGSKMYPWFSLYLRGSF